MTLDPNSHQPLKVILGSATIKAYVASPKEFKVIGIVRWGMEYGLLATTASGDYVRVNGSQIESLIKQSVEKAIQAAKLGGRGCPYSSEHPSEIKKQPTVLVKKRRHPILPECHTFSIAPMVPKVHAYQLSTSA